MRLATLGRAHPQDFRSQRRLMRSKTRRLAGSRGSRRLSRFAAFFVDTRAEMSIVTGCVITLKVSISHSYKALDMSGCATKLYPTSVVCMGED